MLRCIRLGRIAQPLRFHPTRARFISAMLVLGNGPAATNLIHRHYTGIFSHPLALYTGDLVIRRGRPPQNGKLAYRLMTPILLHRKPRHAMAMPHHRAYSSSSPGTVLSFPRLPATSCFSHARGSGPTKNGLIFNRNRGKVSDDTTLYQNLLRDFPKSIAVCSFYLADQLFE